MTDCQNIAGNKENTLKLKLALCLAVIALLLYVNSVSNGFALDDVSVVTNNTIVAKGISAIPEILLTPYRWGFIHKSNDLYRPLSLILFASEYEFFGPNPLPFHITNIILFAVCVILLFYFLDNFFEHKKIRLAFIAALLFALHPIHTEVVDNIKSCDELLCFIFVVSCLNIFLNYSKNGTVILLLSGSVCYLLALLAKETAITFLAIIPLIFFFYKNEHKRRSIYITASIAIIASVALFARFSVLSFYDANHIFQVNTLDGLARQDFSIPARIATSFILLNHYLKLLLIPYPLIWDYSYIDIPFVHFSNPIVLISMLVYVFIFFYCMALVLRFHKNIYAFCFLFFIALFSVISNIPFLTASSIAERFMFLPSVAFCLFCGLVIEKITGNSIKSPATLKNKNIWIILLPVSIVYVIITCNRNTDWKDNYTLYKSDIQQAPNSANINYFLGCELVSVIADKEQDPANKKKIIEEGIPYLKKALIIYPEYVSALTYLAYSYYNISEYDSAATYNLKAYELYPENMTFISNLAGIYMVLKRYTQAIDLFKKIARSDPNDASSYATIGLCYKYLEVNDSAKIYAKKANDIDPRNTLAQMILSSTP